MEIIFNGYHHAHCSIRPTEETFREDCEEVRKHICCDLRDIERALQQLTQTYRVFDAESGISERIYNAKLSTVLTRKHLEQSGIKQSALHVLAPNSEIRVERPDKLSGTKGDEMDENKRDVLQYLDSAMNALRVLETKRHRQYVDLPETGKLYRLALQSIYNDMLENL